MPANQGTDLTQTTPKRKPAGYRTPRNAPSRTGATESRVSAPKPKRPGFESVAGMDELKETLRRDVIDALRQRDRYREYGLTIPNGILFYGPPGCGKSFMAERFAGEVGCRVIAVTRSDVASIFVDGSVEKIRALFDRAKKLSPCVLLFDEFDAVVPNRGADLHQGYRTEVNEFLTQLQGISKFNVIFLATTNSPELIDPAILRSGRIDRLVYVSPPDERAREDMFRIHLESRPKEDGIDLTHLATLTEHFVASDIKLIVDDAARVALRDHTRISERNLTAVILSRRPSISPALLSKYKQIQDDWAEHGSGGEPRHTQNVVGFQRPRRLTARG